MCCVLLARSISGPPTVEKEGIIHSMKMKPTLRSVPHCIFETEVALLKPVKLNFSLDGHTGLVSGNLVVNLWSLLEKHLISSRLLRENSWCCSPMVKVLYSYQLN